MRFNIGAVHVHRVEELSVRLPFAMFGASEELIAKSASWLFPHWVDSDRTWELVVQSWILEADGQIVVVDPCVGNGRSAPGFPAFRMLDTPFIERFAATGIRPEQVNAVFCTHLHEDHCGWNTTLRDGRYVPTFPNARYYLSRREVEARDFRARTAGTKDRVSSEIFAASVLPILEAGLAELIPDNFALSASLTALAAPGHTVGHSMLRVKSDGSSAYFTGDLFHHPIELVHPELNAQTSEDFTLTLASRRRLFDRAIDSGALLVPAHFAAPHVGYLREVDGRPVFEAWDPSSTPLL